MAKPLSGFIGFPDVKMRPVIVPDFFFAELLPQIDDLAELKLTLHCFWLLNEQSGDLRYIQGEVLRQDEKLLASLNLDSDLRSPQQALADALERSVARLTLLRMEVTTGEGDEALTEDWYFMNTVKGRQAVAAIRQGRLDELRAMLPSEARVAVERPNLFILYEQNIGMMTPLIAEQLRDMEKSYPPDWVEEAFDIAVARNKRALRYIQAILKRWESEGKDDGSLKGHGNHETSGSDSAAERRRKYIPDEFSDIIIG